MRALLIGLFGITAHAAQHGVVGSLSMTATIEGPTLALEAEPFGASALARVNGGPWRLVDGLEVVVSPEWQIERPQRLVARR